MLSGDTRVQRATKWRGFWRALAVATKEATDKDRQNEALKQGMFQKQHAIEQINFEMLHISKFSFSQKMRSSAESTPRCGTLHFRAALEHLHFFKVKMLQSIAHLKCLLTAGKSLPARISSQGFSVNPCRAVNKFHSQTAPELITVEDMQQKRLQHPATALNSADKLRTCLPGQRCPRSRHSDFNVKLL